MKVILSKKGLDSGCSNWPIFLKNNTKEMPFIPIPEMNGMHTYGVLNVASCEKLYFHKSHNAILVDENVTCHLDPQLEDYFGYGRNFRATFGQSGRAQSHLNNCGVGVGDLFLFYGWYYNENTKKDENIIFGYMKIGIILGFDLNGNVFEITKQNQVEKIGNINKKDFVQEYENKYKFLTNQPHWVRLKDDFKTNYKNDVIYIAENGGFGIFNYKESLILTDKEEKNCKTEWFIDGLENITELHPMRRKVALKEGRGRLVKGYCQELVIDCVDAEKWAEGLILAKENNCKNK